MVQIETNISKDKFTEEYNIERNFPSEDLDKNISYKYKIPFNLNEKEFEALIYTFIDDKYIIDFLFFEALCLNGELRIFSDHKPLHIKCCILGGIASRFNIDDILFYIENDLEILSIEDNYYVFNNKEYERYYNMLGNYISYFPSINTIKKILNYSS